MMKKIIIALYVVMIGLVSYAETPLVYEGSVSGNVSSGDFAPYYIMSNNGGVLTQPDAVLMRLDATKEMDKRSRFSYGFGLSAIGGWQSEYKQYCCTRRVYAQSSRRESLGISVATSIRRGKVQRRFFDHGIERIPFTFAYREVR